MPRVALYFRVEAPPKASKRSGPRRAAVREKSGGQSIPISTLVNFRPDLIVARGGGPDVALALCQRGRKNPLTIPVKQLEGKGLRVVLGALKAMSLEIVLENRGDTPARVEVLVEGEFRE